jgi:hypothetical protein
MTTNALRNVRSVQRKIGESRYTEMMKVAGKTQAKSSVLDGH